MFFFVRQELTSERLNIKVTIKRWFSPRRIRHIALRGCSRSEYHGRDGSDVFMWRNSTVHPQPATGRRATWRLWRDGWIDIGDSEWFRYVQNDLEWFTVHICGGGKAGWGDDHYMIFIIYRFIINVYNMLRCIRRIEQNINLESKSLYDIQCICMLMFMYTPED